MLYPQEMTEIELIVPERNTPAVTSILANQGNFQQTDTSFLTSSEEPVAIESWQEKANLFSSFERRILAIMQALTVDEGPPPSSGKASIMKIEKLQSKVNRLEKQTQGVIDQLTEEQKKVEQLQSYIQQLEPIADLNLKIGTLRNPRYVFSMPGIMPVNNIERLRISLVRVPFVLLTLRQDVHQAVVWLLGTQRDSGILNRAARSAYLNPLNLPDAYRGTPTQIIHKLQTAIQRAHAQQSKHQSALEKLGQKHKKQLHTLLWHTRASRMLANSMAHFGKLRHTYIIIGWVPSLKLEDLSQRLKAVSKGIVIEANSPDRRGSEQNVPVELHNPGIFGAFQKLVTAYGWPRYGEVDPTFLITLTFPLLFGAMFGDVGHGLVLAMLGGLLASRRINALKSLAGLGLIVTLCGSVATIFGFLYGSIFGMEDILPVLWIRPMDSIMQILTVAIGAGILLLSLGFMIGMLNAWLAREWGRFFFSPSGFAGLMLYWSLIGLIAQTFLGKILVPVSLLILLTLVSGFSIMFSDPLGRLLQKNHPLFEGNFATYLVQAFFELFETLISYLSNSLSFVRVGAFAVAHGGLSAVIFILANMVFPAKGPGYWIVVAFGNLFIIGFEGLIVSIQSLRLEYYEFFSKFFSGSGSRYKPLTLSPETGE